MDPPSKGKPPHLFKHYKDIKILTNNGEASLSGDRQHIFIGGGIQPLSEAYPHRSQEGDPYYIGKRYSDDLMEIVSQRLGHYLH